MDVLIAQILGSEDLDSLLETFGFSEFSQISASFEHMQLKDFVLYYSYYSVHFSIGANKKLQVLKCTVDRVDDDPWDFPSICFFGNFNKFDDRFRRHFKSDRKFYHLYPDEDFCGGRL